ncbi:MAG: nucleotidyltransferase, partial [Nitrospirota bacterium]
VDKGIIKTYAIGGGIGTMFYTETFFTKDLDVFILPQLTESGIIYLEKLYKYLRNAGYKMEEQYSIIHDIPVDFIPVYDELTEEALNNAVEKKYEGIKVRVISPEYLIAIGLKTGRKQDLMKVELLCKEAKLDCDLLNSIKNRYKL